ncbi:MAG: malectin domain-containing carbohydrate-binding protein, partial [Pseudomonadota bacterium]
AILAPDSPVRVFADGQRNPFDIVLRSSDGQLFSVDNGGNGGLGGNPNEFNGEPVNSPNGGGDTDDEPLLLLSEGSNAGHPVPVRANPDGPGIIFNDAGQVNQDPATFTAEQQAVVDALGLSTIDPGDTDALNAALTTAIVPDLSALVPASLGIEPGFLIDPSRFAAGPGQNLDDLTPQELADRLAESGDRVDRSAGAGGSFAPISGDDAPTNNINALAFFDNTTNGITEYFGSAFANALNGALITASSNGNITLLNVNADGTGLDPIIVNGETVDQDGIVVISPGGLGFQLDVTTGPVGSQFEGLVFSAGFGPDNISVLAPTDQVIPGDPDIDNDGLFETNDPFTRDASNGAQATIGAQDTLVLDFDNNQDGNLLGPDGFGSGLTGLAINGVDNPEVVLFGDPEDPADGGLIGNVRIGTAAGGGVVNIVNVEQGTSAGTDNDQPLLFQSGFRVTPGVETFTARWVVGNPGLDIPDDATGENNGFVSGTNQEIGGFLGTGDQSNILRVVATHAGGSSGNSGAGFIVELENDDIIQSSQFISAADLFDNVNEIDNIFETITIEILVDRANGTATPTITYVNGGTTDTTTVVGDPVDISGSNLEAAINNDFLLAADQGPDEISGIALGLFSSNGDATPDQAFSAIFDEVTVDTTGVPLTVIHRVNFGGGEVEALDGGPAFTADTNGNPSPFRVLDNMASNENVDSFGVTAGPTVSSSVPQAIFDSGRFDVATAGSPGELTYIFPDLEDGTYLVTVFLGNGFPGASTVGARIFDINLEGSVPTEFEDIDPVALFGDGVGGQLSAFVEVTDGALDVEFLHQVENPNPFGIE